MNPLVFIRMKQKIQILYEGVLKPNVPHLPFGHFLHSGDGHSPLQFIHFWRGSGVRSICTLFKEKFILCRFETTSEEFSTLNICNFEILRTIIIDTIVTNSRQ
jgi:hypothetical protein